MYSQSFLNTLQTTVDFLSHRREEVNAERLENIERSLLSIVARLDRLESAGPVYAKSLSKPIGTEDVLASTERMMREVLVEMVKQQNIVEKYRQENEELKARLSKHTHVSTTSSTHTAVKQQPSASFPSTTTVPRTNPNVTSHSVVSAIPTSIIPKGAVPSSGKRPAPTYTTTVSRAGQPPQRIAPSYSSKAAEAEDHDSSEDAEHGGAATPTAAPAGNNRGVGQLPVEFPPGFVPNRRFSVAGEPYNPNMDFSSVPRTVIKKPEDTKKRIRNVITNNILFKNLDEEPLEELIDEMFEVRLRPEEVIVRQDDDGDNFYVIDSGELYVLYRDVVVATIGSGKSFGEIALMYNVPRTATVKAKTDCILWGMSRNTFRRSLMVYAIKKRELYESFLSRVPLLESLLAYERSIIADALETRTCRDGDYIIRQGEKGDNFYIVEKGKTVVTKGEPPVEVKVCKEGDYFGELALLNDQPRAANVRAVGAVRLLCLSRADFSSIMGPCEDVLKRNMAMYNQVQGQDWAGGQQGSSTPAPAAAPRPFNEAVADFAAQEDAYTKGLAVAVKEFLHPLRKAAEKGGEVGLSAEEVAQLFSNAEMLLNIHNTIAPDMSTLSQLPPSQVGKVFLKLAPGLKFYQTYCKDWKNASAILEKKKNDESLNAFLKVPSRAPYDLYALLRAPVDRVHTIWNFLREISASNNDKDLVEATNKLASISAELSRFK